MPHPDPFHSNPILMMNSPIQSARAFARTSCSAPLARRGYRSRGGWAWP